MSCVRVLLCILLPPLAVLDKGCGSIILVTLLTCVAWIPGVLAALIITSQQPATITVGNQVAPYSPSAYGLDSQVPRYYSGRQSRSANNRISIALPRLPFPLIVALVLVGILIIMRILGILIALVTSYIPNMASTATVAPTVTPIFVIAYAPTPSSPTPLQAPLPPVVLTQNAERLASFMNLAATPVAEQQISASRQADPPSLMDTPVSLPPTQQPLPPQIPDNTNITVAERVYISKVDEQESLLNRELDYLNADLQAANLHSDDWIMSVATEAGSIMKVADDALKLDAPPRLQKLDQVYKSGMAHFKKSMITMARGIDQRDDDLLNQAADEMELGSDDDRQAMNLLFTFINSHN